MNKAFLRFGGYEQAVIYSIMNEEPEPISRLRSGVPSQLEKSVNKAIAKNPDERYHHVDKMLVNLKAAARRLESSASKERYANLEPLARTRRVIYSAATILALLISAAGIIFYIGQKEGDEGISSEENTEASSSGNWENSIAVLPFENISPDPEQEYFCDGITEQINTNLSQLQESRLS